MGGRGEIGFEGLEVKGGKISNGSVGRNAVTDETVGVGLNISQGRELRVRKRGEGGGLMIGDKGL